MHHSRWKARWSAVLHNQLDHIFSLLSTFRSKVFLLLHLIQSIFKKLIFTHPVYHDAACNSILLSQGAWQLHVCANKLMQHQYLENACLCGEIRRLEVLQWAFIAFTADTLSQLNEWTAQNAEASLDMN